LKRECRHPLPDLYLDFLRFSNGGFGPLQVQPYTFVCFEITEVLELHTHPHYANWLHDFVVIGGDGAGEFIALDYRKAPSIQVVAIDMCNFNLEETLLVAENFEVFVHYIGLESPDLPHFESTPDQPEV
ncbi:MAG: SMI1/KNR4 family protein, partial [Phycisphaerae bacterium]